MTLPTLLTAIVEALRSAGATDLPGTRKDSRQDCKRAGAARNDTPGSNAKGRIVTPKGDIAAAAKLTLAASPEPQTEPKPTRVEAMRAKLKAGGHASPYRLRKQLPEPVFGQIKQARGFRQFLLRGFEKVCGEWAMVCTAHNLLKLAQGRTLSAALPQAAG